MKRKSSRRGTIVLGLVFLGSPSGAGCRSRPPKDAVASWDAGFVTRAEAVRYFTWLDARHLRTRSEVDAKKGVTEVLAELAFLKMMAAEAGDETSAPGVLYLDGRGAFLARYYMERKGKRSYEVTDEEAMAVYREHLPDRFTLPESSTFQHVFLRSDRHSPEELARLVRVVLDGLGRGTPIEELAATYSESQTSRAKGTVGPVYRGKLEPVFEEQLYRLKKGRPGVVRTDQGTHVVVVTSRTPARALPFEEVKGQIVSGIMNSRNQTGREELMASLRRRYGVVDRSGEPNFGPDEVVLRVKDRSLTRRELEELLEKSLEGRGGAKGANAALRRRVIEDTVSSNLFYLDAVDGGLDKEQAFVDRWEIRQLSARSRLAIGRRLEAEAKKLGDDVVAAYYRENQGRFFVPQKFQASYIFMPFGGAPPFQLQQRIEELEKLASSPAAERAELERRCVEAGASYVDMGWATPIDAARVAPEFQRRMLAQTTPGSTGVIKEEEGLYVILVKAIEARRSMTEPADHEAIRARYVALRQEEMVRELRERELKDRGFRVLSTAVFEAAGAKG